MWRKLIICLKKATTTASAEHRLVAVHLAFKNALNPRIVFSTWEAGHVLTKKKYILDRHYTAWVTYSPGP